MQQRTQVVKTRKRSMTPNPMVESSGVIEKELDRSYSTLNNHYSLLIQLLVVVTAVAGLLGGYYFSNIQIGNVENMILMWLLPLSVVATIGAGIVILYQINFLVYFIRFLGAYIKEQTGDDRPLLYYDQGSFPSVFQSYTRGNRFFNMARLGIIFLPVLLLVVIVWLGFEQIYNIDHLHGLLYFGFFSICGAALVSGFARIFSEVPHAYDRYLLEYLQDPQAAKEIRLPFDNRGLLFFLLPRPVDFMSKAPIFALGSVIALVGGHVRPQPTILALAFSPPLPNEIWGTLIFTFCWFIIQSVFIEQAKYQWNDIRDRKRDELIPANRVRYSATSRLRPELEYASLGVRWVGGIIMASILSQDLLAFVLLFSFLQIAYELWTKPRSDKWPLLPMMNVASGTTLRFVSGAVAVGWLAEDPMLILLGISMFILGAAYSSTMWRTEATYMRNAGIPLQRGQSEYFEYNGRVWLIVSFIGTSTLFAFMLWLIYKYGSPPMQLLLLQQTPRFPSLVTELLVNYLGSSALFLCVVAIPVLAVKRRFRRTELKISNGGTSSSTSTSERLSRLLLISSSCVVIAGSGFIYWLFLAPQFVPYMICTGVTSLIFFLLVIYWSTSYEEFSLLYLFRNLPEFVHALRDYFFVADSPCRAKDLLFQLLSINTKQFSKSVCSEKQAS